MPVGTGGDVLPDDIVGDLLYGLSEELLFRGKVASHIHFFLKIKICSFLTPASRLRERRMSGMASLTT